MTMLKVSSVTKQGEGDFTLREITFTQKKNQKIAVAGETGSGKSTLLRIVAGLEQQDDGDVYFENDPVIGPAGNLVPGHPRISYLSQNFELPKFLRVEQVLTYSNTLSDQTAGTLYEVCRISHLLKRRTDQLSGGERQRIAMARLLSSSPALLLLDEPFTHLDMPHKNILKSVIHDIGAQLKISCILVSHDPADTLSWADMVLVMKDGKIIQKGSPEKIYRQPVDEYTAGLFGRYNILPKEIVSGFFKPEKIRKNRKSILVRPDAFRLVAKGRHTVKGKVTGVRFYGSYHELDVTLERSVAVTVRSQNAVALNKTVFVSLSPDQVSYV